MTICLGAAVRGAVMTLAFTAAATSSVSAQNVSHGTHSGAPVVGAASMYNPHRGGRIEGGIRTASGERYDVSGWTAAVKTNLRGKFGGVGYHAKPKYALVKGAGKKAIVKINDVGPLAPGRVIDLNERTMRYFDPSLARGVISGMKVTPLAGRQWTAGPVASADMVASR